MASAAIDKVIVLNDFCHVQGGASKVAIDEAVALSANGLDVAFLGAVGPVCNTLRDARLHVTCLDQPELADVMRHPGAALRGLWNRGADAALRDLLAPLDPRRCIVHMHGYTKALTAGPAFVARQAGFRTICTLHDFFAACPNGAFYDYRRQQPCPLVALSPACIATPCDKRNQAHKAYRVVRAFTQRHIAHFPASIRDYITLSRRSTELLQPYLPAGSSFYPLENIIDLPQAPPVNVSVNRSLLVIGRLDAEKGVTMAAQAARQAGWPIVFAGEGPQHRELEAMGGVVTGWLSADQIWHKLADARCLIFPSRWYETFGLVVSEAAARGVPALVSDISAAAERVTDGVTGWIFRSGDPTDLIRCLLKLRDDAVVAALGNAAYRRFWSGPPSRQRHTEALLSIYGKVLAREDWSP